jgi:hypothetical protein
VLPLGWVIPLASPLGLSLGDLVENHHADLFTP